MSARDELAEVIRYGRGEDASVRVSECDLAVTDAVLAAGYSKPRTVTTTQELEALPEGAVVLDADTWLLRKSGRSWHAAGSHGSYSIDAIALPATVLFEPAP